MNTKSLIYAIAVSSIALASCQENLTPGTQDENTKTYTVSLACAGELDVTHDSLTKSESSTDLYGIEVLYAPVSGGSYQHYAYGLFDDLSNTTIELLADYKYTFKVDLIIDGKNAIYHEVLNEEDQTIVYGKPFHTNSSSKLQQITNTLNITTDTYFKDLGGAIDTPTGEGKNYDPKNVDAYYGKTTDYVPTENGEVITIMMKHMIYGLKVIADDFLNEGIVYGIFGANATTSTVHHVDNFTLTPEEKTYESTYAYYDRDNWYDEELLDDANTDRQIALSWNKNDETTLTLNTQKIRMIRMKQTVVNVTFFENEVSGTNSLGISLEELEMTENETSYTFGDEQDEYEW